MKVGIDFDRVLFRTEKFKKLLFDRIESFEETYTKVDGVYDPEKHAEILGIPEKRIHNALEEASKFLYSDTALLEDSEHEFIIVSRGDPVFQKEKIERSGAVKHVSDYIIVQERPKNVEGIDMLVDDLEEEIERAGVPGFHFNRDENDIRDILEEISDRE